MTVNSFPELRDRILSCLEHSIEDNSNNNEAAWGVVKQSGRSVVNTVEALLTLQELDALSVPYLETRKDKILRFLKRLTIAELKKPTIATRYIAYGALGFHILGDSELENDCIARLIRSANPDGGWSLEEEIGDSFVVPTYQAMFALQNIGVSIDEKHYAWLLSMQRSDSLLPFASSDQNTSFGPSSIVLYILANSSYSDRTAVAKLAGAVKHNLPIIFERMAEPNSNWAEQDSRTGFRIFGYGHALAALNLLDENLFSLGLRKFLNVVSINCNSETKQINPAFAFSPTETWVPALFELAFALRSIRLNFDPFKYHNSQQAERMAEVSAEIDAEKNRLAEESKINKTRQIVFDEWEKELIRQRRISYELTRFKDEVAVDFTRVKDEVASTVIAELKSILPTIVAELKSTLGFYLRVLILAIFALGYIFIRLTVDENVSLKMDGIVGFAGLAGFVLVEAIIKNRNRNKFRTTGTERANLGLMSSPRRD